jgi:hypothetical protein
MWLFLAGPNAIIELFTADRFGVYESNAIHYHSFMDSHP